MTRTQTRAFTVLCLCLGFAAVSCKKKTSPAAPVTPPAAPTDTFTITQTPSPSATPTVTSSPTVTSTPTSTQTPYCNSPLSYGFTSGTAGLGTASAYMVMGKANQQVPGWVVSLSAYVSSGNVRFALYSDNAGAPGTLIVQTGVVAGTGWTTAPVPNTNLAAGDYWIATLAESNYVWSESAASAGCYYFTQAWGAFPAAPTGGVNVSSSMNHMVRANYCPTAPTFTPTATPVLTPTQTLTPVPTCAATAGTFGDSGTTGGYIGSTAVWLLASPYSLPVNASLTQISFYAVPGGGVGFARVGLYDHDPVNNKPTTLIVQNTYPVEVATSSQWYNVDIPPTSLAAGTYWLAIMLRPTVIGSGSIPGISLFTGTAYQSYLGSSWGNMPSSFGGSTYGSEVALVGKYCTP